MDLKEVDSFIRIARAGSLSRAARLHDVPKASLSHHLRRLEDRLGVALFTRLPRRLELTDAGREFLSHCHQIVEACDIATNSVRDYSEDIVGTLRVGAGTEFGTSLIGPMVREFSVLHPKLSCEVHMLSHDQAKLEQFDLDCIIYIGTPPDSSLIQKRLGDFIYRLYCSPGYLAARGEPASVKALDGHSGIIHIREQMAERWRLTSGRKSADILPTQTVKTNDFWMVKYFAIADLGIAFLPDFFVHHEVNQGALIAVLDNWQSSAVPIYALYPKHRYRNRNVKAFVDMWTRDFDAITADAPYSLVGGGAGA